MWLLPWTALQPFLHESVVDRAETLWLWSRTDDSARRLLPRQVKLETLYEACQALRYGAGKYGAFVWEKGQYYTDVVSSGLRHALKAPGIDPESGLSHSVHLSANVVIAWHFMQNAMVYRSYDDRPHREILEFGDAP